MKNIEIKNIQKIDIVSNKELLSNEVYINIFTDKNNILEIGFTAIHRDLNKMRKFIEVDKQNKQNKFLKFFKKQIDFDEIKDSVYGTYKIADIDFIFKSDIEDNLKIIYSPQPCLNYDIVISRKEMIDLCQKIINIHEYKEEAIKSFSQNTYKIN